VVWACAVEAPLARSAAPINEMTNRLNITTYMAP
jgi:hypothetical protein